MGQPWCSPPSSHSDQASEPSSQGDAPGIPLLPLPPSSHSDQASEPSSKVDAPVIPLLGYFTSAPSDVAATASTDDTIDSIWLVYKWEGLRPMSMLMQEGPPQPVYGLLKSRCVTFPCGGGESEEG